MFQRTIWFLSTQATAKHRVFPPGAVSSSFVPFQWQLRLPVPLMARGGGDHSHPTTGSPEEQGCCVVLPSVSCTCVHRWTASLITNVWGITLKNKCVLEWSRSCCSAHHISLTHTCAQGMFNLDYINSMPTLQKDFKNVPNNRRTISSVISCSQVGLSMHIRCWSPVPPK